MTIAVVVAAVSSVFAVANVTILPPLPFPEPHRLVRVYFQPPGTTSFADADSLDALAFVRFREWTKTFDVFAGIFALERGVTGDREPESIRSGQVTPGFFELLGARVVQGRTFTTSEFANGEKSVVLSHGLWMRRFGGGPVLGESLTIDREPHTIVGVVAPDFEPAFTRSEFWTPLDLRKPNAYFSGIQTIGRLAPGTTVEQAASELNTLLGRVAVEAPSAFNGWKMGARDLKDARYGARRPTLLMLLAAVAALALIAIFNLTNLTLADVSFRQSEIALRAALGGSRARIIHGELMPGVCIAVVGSLLGLAIVWMVAPIVTALDPSGLLGGRSLHIDWRVAGVALLTAGSVIGAAIVLPMLRMTRTNLAPEIALGSRRTAGASAGRRVRIMLVGAQVALGIVLVASGSVVVATFQKAAQMNAGFDPANVITAQIRMSEIALPTPEARLAFIDRVVSALRETPGVIAASTTLNSFVAGLGGARSLAFVEDRPNPDGTPYAIQSRRITPGYFETMKIRLLHGRDFAESDRLGSQPVAIVSQKFADRFWPGQDALNKRVKRGVTTREWSVVIGVADDVRDISLDQEPRDTLYTPFRQSAPSPLPVSLVVRAERDVLETLPAIKAAIWKVDPDQPLANVVTLDAFLRDSLGAQRFRALLVSAFAVVGLLLATLGAYAVTARSVVERQREAGVRLALGGEPRLVWWAIVTPALRAVIAGAIGGLALAWGARSALIWLIPETGATDLTGGLRAAAVLIAAGAIATILAGRSILTLDPLKALEDR